MAVLWGITGCNVVKLSGPTATVTLVPKHSHTGTTFCHPAPMAATVNGEGIQLSDYQGELQRYQAAQSAASRRSMRQ